MLDTLFRSVCSALGGDRFQQSIRQVADRLNARCHFEDADSGAVVVTLKGHTIAVVVERLPDGRVQVTGHSNVLFPPRALPDDFTSFLADRNRQLPHVDWQNFHGSQASNFVAVTNIRSGSFDADMLFTAFRHVLPEVAALDESLVKAGYRCNR